MKVPHSHFKWTISVSVLMKGVASTRRGWCLKVVHLKVQYVAAIISLSQPLAVFCLFSWLGLEWCIVVAVYSFNHHLLRNNMTTGELVSMLTSIDISVAQYNIIFCYILGFRSMRLTTRVRELVTESPFITSSYWYIYLRPLLNKCLIEWIPFLENVSEVSLLSRSSQTAVHIISIF